jgi:hypothetical protein
VSGSIVSHVAHRSEGSRGYWRSIVGDGRSSFKVNSTSGSLYIYAARPEDRVVAEASPAAPSAPPAPSAPAAPAAPAWSAGGAASATPVEDPAPAETEETWSPDEDGVAGGESGGESVAEVDPEDDLAVLQALERGEIGVDEAADRLARSKGLGHVG